MIALVLAMLRARRGQAVTLALLALLAVAAAVAAPAYLAAVDRAVVASEVAAAGPTERGVTISASSDNRQPGRLRFGDVGAALVSLPGFTDVYSARYAVVGVEADPHRSSRVVFRQNACAHLIMVTGRCLIGEGEVLVGTQTAHRLGLGAGGPVSLVYARLSEDPRTPWYLPDGTPATVTVVGTYRVPIPDDPYWGAHGYFAVDAGGAAAEPVFTNAATMTQMDHGDTELSIDATPGPDTFTVDRLDGLRANLDQLHHTIASLGQSVVLDTAIPRLLDRIDAGRSLSHQTVPVLAIPLIMLAYFVIFLAAGRSVDGRRTELGVVALRGARWYVRWWLATGESLVAIAAGAVAGCVAGQLLVIGLVAGRFPGGGAAVFDPRSLRYALAAAAGAAIVAVLAQHRPLRTPVADLSRRIISRTGGWRLAVGEAVVAVLGVVAVAQLWTTDGSLVGVGMFAAALVMATLALVGAQALLPLAGWYGRRALRRGRLGGALAAFHLARRPGAQRLFALLAGAVAIASFVACAVDVAQRDRDIAAQVGTGASRVLSVGQTSRIQLLQAVRAADPDGRWAMAVAKIPDGAPGEPPKIAVDSARLPAVAVWPDTATALTAPQVAARLRPPASRPVVVPGQDVTLDLTVSGAQTFTPLSLTVVLTSNAGRGTVLVPFGMLHNGPYTFQQRAPACAEGCRLVGFHLTTEGSSAVDTELGLTLRGLRTINPPQVAASSADLADVTRWRVPAGGSLAPAPDGLRVDFHAPDGIPGGGWIQPADAPYPLPVVSTATLPAGAAIAGFDGSATPVVQVGQVGSVPRLGASGTLVDLEYADRVATDAGTAVDAQVWLGPAAPADALARIAGAGLVVIGDQRLDGLRGQLDQQGPALVLRFFLLVGALAIGLAAGGLSLVATVDRRPRAAELAALRAQGVRSRTIAWTVLCGYPAMAVGAGLLGLATALIAWRLTGWALPVFSTPQPALTLPIWPRPLAVLLPWSGAVVVLVAVALATGQDLRRAVRRSRAG